MPMTARSLARWVVIVLAVFLVVGQFVPADRTNPPVDSAQTLEASMRPPAEVAAVLDRSCSDCHSNETKWPWYSRVAPVSWLLAHDVKEGRSHLNFSNWGSLDTRRAGNKLEEICEEVRSGAMPQGKYVFLHPEARLSQQDVEAICAWTDSSRAGLEQQR